MYTYQVEKRIGLLLFILSKPFRAREVIYIQPSNPF